jgi:hypothetical protein
VVGNEVTYLRCVRPSHQRILPLLVVDLVAVFLAAFCGMVFPPRAPVLPPNLAVGCDLLLPGMLVPQT